MLTPKRLTAALVAAIILQLITATVASAHAALLRSDPSDGATLETAPEQVTMWFDEPVSAQFSSMRLLDGDSQPVSGATVHDNPDDPTSLIVKMPPLDDGVYTLLWQVLSASDGHYAQGVLVLGIGASAELTGAGAAPVQQTTLWQEVALRWANFTFIVLLIGALAIMRFVLPAPANATDDETEGPGDALRGLLPVARWSAIAALLVGFGILAWQTSQLKGNLPEGTSLPVAVWDVLTATSWGWNWLLRMGALAGILAAMGWGLAWPRGRAAPTVKPWAWPIIALFGILILLAQALTSHAPSVRDDRALAVVVDALHLLAAGLWIGGLFALALVSWAFLRRGREDVRPLMQATWRRFSAVAAISVTLLFATGLYSMGVEVASPDALLTTFYGRALMTKLAIVLIVVLIGGLNALLLHPRLAQPLGRVLGRGPEWRLLSPQRQTSLIFFEVALGMLALLATATVTASAAPRGIEYRVGSEQIPSALSLMADDMTVTLQVKPNQPGQNVFHIFAASRRRPPPAEIMRVIVRFSYKNEDLGLMQADAEKIDDDRYPLRYVEEGRYLLTGNYLSLAGPWTIDVIVRRRGIPDSVASFDWMVAPPGELTPTVVSRAPLEPWTTGLAVLLMLMIPLIVFLITRPRSPADGSAGGTRPAAEEGPIFTEENRAWEEYA